MIRCDKCVHEQTNLFQLVVRAVVEQKGVSCQRCAIGKIEILNETVKPIQAGAGQDTPTHSQKSEFFAAVNVVDGIFRVVKRNFPLQCPTFDLRERGPIICMVKDEGVGAERTVGVFITAGQTQRL